MNTIRTLLSKDINYILNIINTIYGNLYVKNQDKLIKNEPKYKSFNQFSEFYEQKIEDKIIDLLFNIGVKSSIKQQKETLPYTDIITVKKSFTSFMNDSFDVKDLYYQLMKFITENNLNKIRFYVKMDLIESKDDKTKFLGIKYNLYIFKHK